MCWASHQKVSVWQTQQTNIYWIKLLKTAPTWLSGINKKNPWPFRHWCQSFPGIWYHCNDIICIILPAAVNCSSRIITRLKSFFNCFHLFNFNCVTFYVVHKDFQSQRTFKIVVLLRVIHLVHVQNFL